MQPDNARASLFADVRPTWGRKEVEAQKASGWKCYGCAKNLAAGEGIVLTSASGGTYLGMKVTHGLYCSRRCNQTIKRERLARGT